MKKLILILLTLIVTLTSCTGLEVAATYDEPTVVYVNGINYYKLWYQGRYVYYPYSYGPHWRPTWHYHFTPTPPPTHHKPHRPDNRPPVQPSHRPDGTPNHRPGTGHPGYSNPPTHHGGNVRPNTRSFNGSRGGNQPSRRP